MSNHPIVALVILFLIDRIVEGSDCLKVVASNSNF